MKDSGNNKPGTSQNVAGVDKAVFNETVGGTTVDGVTTYGGVVKYTL